MIRVELAGGGPADGELVVIPHDHLPELRVPHCRWCANLSGVRYRYERAARAVDGITRAIYLYAGEVAA